MGLNRFPINDFSGGWNIRDDPSVLQPNESPLMINVTLGPVGQLQQRAGTNQYSDIGATSIDNLFLFREPTNGDDKLLISDNGALKALNLTRGGLVTLRAGTPGDIWSFESMNNAAGTPTLYAVGGFPQLWDGVAASSTNWSNPQAGMSIARAWRNRMILTGGVNATFSQRIWYSNVGDPTTGLSSNFLEVGQRDADDPVTGLQVLGDNLIVFKRESVWMVYDPVSFANRRLGGPGCEGPFQTAVVGNRCYYFHRSGIYSVGLNGDIRSESDQIRPVFTGETLPGGTPAPVDRLEMTQLSKARVCATPNDRIYVSIPTAGANFNVVMYELIPNFSVRTTGNRRTQLQSAIMRHGYSVGAPQTLALINFANGERRLLGSFTNLTAVTRRQIFDFSSTALLDYSSTAVVTSMTSFWYTGYRGVQDEEPIERLRRVGALYSGRFRLRTGDPIGGTYTEATMPNVVPPAIAYNRTRPEQRSRYHQIGVIGTDQSLGATGWSISSFELVYRGGKEH